LFYDIDLKKFFPIADYVFIGGALANNFYKALGFPVGKSLVENANFHLTGLLKKEKLLLPVDVEVRDGKEHVVRRPGEVKKGEIGEVLDALSRFVPEIINENGDRFLNNIAIVKKYREISPSKQVILTNGEFIEQEIMSGAEPVIFIGGSNIIAGYLIAGRTVIHT